MPAAVSGAPLVTDTFAHPPAVPSNVLWTLLSSSCHQRTNITAVAQFGSKCQAQAGVSAAGAHECLISPP